MVRIKLYMDGADADRVNGLTLEDIINQVEETGNYTIIRDYRFFRNLTITNEYGPGIPADLIVFNADFTDSISDGKHVAVYVTLAITEYFAKFEYNDAVVTFTSYDYSNLADTIIDILSRYYRWGKKDIRRNAITLAGRLAGMDVGTMNILKLSLTEIWLTVREPSPGKVFEKVTSSFPAGRLLELVE